MDPLTFEQLVALISVIFAGVTLVLAFRRDSHADEERIRTQASEARSVTDKLDHITGMSEETRDTVRDISKQLAEHSKQLARIEEQISDHDRRLMALEGHTGVGETD